MINGEHFLEKLIEPIHQGRRFDSRLLLTNSSPLNRCPARFISSRSSRSRNDQRARWTVAGFEEPFSYVHGGCLLARSMLIHGEGLNKEKNQQNNFQTEMNWAGWENVTKQNRSTRMRLLHRGALVYRFLEHHFYSAYATIGHVEAKLEQMNHSKFVLRCFHEQ